MLLISDPSAETVTRPDPRSAGPWSRSTGEIEGAWAVLGALVSILTARPERAAAQLSDEERYLLGMRAAARWTLGLTALTPLTGAPEKPTSARAVVELRAADPTTSGGAAVAAGCRGWLGWLLGEVDDLVFPAL
jgi:hypothetical protein